MIYNIDKIKRVSKYIFFFGILIISAFLTDLFGILQKSLIPDLAKNKIKLFFIGIGLIFLVPYLFLPSIEYKKQNGKHDAQLLYCWIPILFLGVFLMIIPFFLS